MQVNLPVWGFVLFIAAVSLIAVGFRPLRQAFQAIADLLSLAVQLRRDIAPAKAAAKRAELERLAAEKAKQTAKFDAEAKIASGLVAARIESGTTEITAAGKAKAKEIAGRSPAPPAKAAPPRAKRSSALGRWWRSWNDVIAVLTVIVLVIAGFIAGLMRLDHLNTRPHRTNILVCSTYIKYAEGESGHRPQIRLKTPTGEFVVARGFYDDVYYDQGVKLTGFFQANHVYAIVHHGGYGTAQYISEAHLASATAQRCAGS